MKFLQNISINKKIQLVVVLLLIILFAISGYTVYRFSAQRLEKSIHTQMEVYLNNLASIIEEVDKQNEPGFNHQDYASLKPYFNKSAYFSSDIPFMIDASGNYLIHLYREGQRYPREKLNIIFSNPEEEGYFEYTEIINNETHQIIVFYKKLDKFNAFIGIPVSLNEASEDLNKNRYVLILLVIFASIVFATVINIVLKPMVNTIVKIHQNIKAMATGEKAKTLDYKSKDEIGQIVESLNALIEGLSKTAKFADEIGHNNLNSDFKPLGANDTLGNSLLSMRESLKHAAEEEALRKEEDERRNWINSGLAKFGDILRQNNNDLQILSDNITQNLLNYLGANQGGLFILSDEQDEEPHLQLLSSFAFNHKKFKTKSILLGEGLVGNCAVEKQTIYLKEIPADYIEITSGLGDATPRSLLITPLKLEEKVFGVIEIASFDEFKNYEIEFVEKIGENIASTLSAVKNSIRTSQLLEQSQQQSEEMAAQEEEMRQNMEEMQATQEEMARKTLEMEGVTSAINEALLFCELSEDGSFLFTNFNFMNLAGYAKNDFEDKTIKDFIHIDNQSTFKEAWSSVINGNAFKGVIKWTNRNDDELYILCSLTPALEENGDIYKIFLLGQDVTESKNIEIMAQQQAEEIEQNLIELQTEQDLSKQREDEMSALLQALDTTCLVTEISVDGRITYINQKNVEVLGDKKEDIEGRIHSEIDFEARTNPKKYQKFWNDLLEGKAQRREFSLKVKGKTIWISEHYTPILDETGNVVKIINIGIDVSEGKEIEKKLQEQIEILMKQLNKK